MKGHRSPKMGVEMDGHSSHLSTPPMGEEKKKLGVQELQRRASKAREFDDDAAS